MDIYVGNLPFETTEVTLEVLFRAFGVVSNVKLIKDRDTGRMRGFGFVTMPNKAEAEAAIKGLNEATYLGGRLLRVGEARPPANRSVAHGTPPHPKRS